MVPVGSVGPVDSVEESTALVEAVGSVFEEVPLVVPFVVPLVVPLVVLLVELLYLLEE